MKEFFGPGPFSLSMYNFVGYSVPVKRKMHLFGIFDVTFDFTCPAIRAALVKTLVCSVGPTHPCWCSVPNAGCTSTVRGGMPLDDTG